MEEVNQNETSAAAATSPDLRGEIVKAISSVFDPEIPVNIWELGLIYGIDITPAGTAHVTMTLTSPHCPEAQTLPVQVRNRVQSVPGVTEAEVEIVWDPPWEPSKMSESAKLALNML